VQCEYRVKKFRNEDAVMRKIINRRKAQDHWDKLRKYVMYTWDCKALDDSDINSPQGVCCSSFMVESLPKNGSSIKRRQPSRKDTISFNRKINLPDAKVTAETQVALSCVAESAQDLEGRLSCSNGKLIPPSRRSGAVRNGKGEHPVGLHEGDLPKAQVVPNIDDCLLPPPPSLELEDDSEMTMSDIKKSFQNMYEYNMLLRKKLIDTQSELQCLTRNPSSSGLEK